MIESSILLINATEFRLWQEMMRRRRPIAFELELTARCNNDCRHCYICLPAKDDEARKRELSSAEIRAIVDETVSLGTLWCLLTGGEPLLREDFSDIYLYLKSKGLLISVFTNATLVTEEHVRLFRKYPPRDLEVTVYGVTQETYQHVTRRSFDAFRRGLDLLLSGGVRVKLKTMAMRSNARKLPEIARFCREKSSGSFRFDPFLHLRLDRDAIRNEEIKKERLSPDEIAALERSDPKRWKALTKACTRVTGEPDSENRLFQCGAGQGSFTVGYDGSFRLCTALCKPDWVYDLRSGSVAEAWEVFTPKVRGMRSEGLFAKTCGTCRNKRLCFWCPAHADLETGRPEEAVPYFCETASARAGMLGAAKK